MKTFLTLLITLGFSAQVLAVDYIEVSPQSLGSSPEDYVGVDIKLRCRFVKLDSTWLGDNDVFRSPEEYIGFTVQAADRIFAQLFAPLSLQDELVRFDKADRLIVYGKVFSGRYNFPWIDVDRVTEGWVVGEELEQVKKERRELARNYEDFLKNREGVYDEIGVDKLRRMYFRQEALIDILEEKGVITRVELEQAATDLETAPTPAPTWKKFLEKELIKE